MRPSHNADEFLERTGLKKTLRRPTPAIFALNPVHTIALPFPLPRPDLTRENGIPAPDRVVTRIWPHNGRGA
jgi:hypothetical protein